MKAVRYEAPGDFAVTDVPVPPVGPLDVRIKITSPASVAPTCTSPRDLHRQISAYSGARDDRRDR